MTDEEGRAGIGVLNGIVVVMIILPEDVDLDETDPPGGDGRAGIGVLNGIVEVFSAVLDCADLEEMDLVEDDVVDERTVCADADAEDLVAANDVLVEAVDLIAEDAELRDNEPETEVVAVGTDDEWRGQAKGSWF